MGKYRYEVWVCGQAGRFASLSASHRGFRVLKSLIEIGPISERKILVLLKCTNDILI